MSPAMGMGSWRGGGSQWKGVQIPPGFLHSQAFPPQTAEPPRLASITLRHARATWPTLGDHKPVPGPKAPKFLPPLRQGNGQRQHLGKTDEPICPGASQEPDPDVPLPAAPMSPEPGKPGYGWEPACPHGEEGSPGVLGRLLHPRSCSVGERLHSLLDGSNNKTSHGGRAAEMHLWNAEQQTPPVQQLPPVPSPWAQQKKEGTLRVSELVPPIPQLGVAQEGEPAKTCAPKREKNPKTPTKPCAGAFSPARTRNSHLRLGGMGAGDAAHGGGVRLSQRWGGHTHKSRGHGE